jgi:hypothetical protein
MGYFFAKGAWKEMLRQIAFAGVRGFATNPIPYPEIFSPLPAGNALDLFLSGLGRAAFYMPFLVILSFMATWIVERRQIKGPLACFHVAVAASALLAFSQLYARSDFAHLWQAYPVVDLMAALSLGIIGKKSRLAGTISALVFLLVVGGAAFSSNDLYHGSLRVLERRTIKYENPLAPVRLTPEEYSLMKDVEDTIRKNTSPGDYIFLAPDIPLFYFLTGRLNPTPWDVVRPSFLWGEKDQERAIKLIEKSEVRLVVIREPDEMPPTEKPMSESYPMLYDYLMTHYTYFGRRNDFAFYYSRPRSGPAWPVP